MNIRFSGTLIPAASVWFQGRNEYCPALTGKAADSAPHVLLNYSRIQDIHLRSNLIERWLGLARIEIQTASGADSSNMTLEGMEDPEGMRDFLYSRMRSTREDKTTEADPLAAVMHEIAGELREIRALVERSRA